MLAKRDEAGSSAKDLPAGWYAKGPGLLLMLLFDLRPSHCWFRDLSECLEFLPLLDVVSMRHLFSSREGTTPSLCGARF
ncbi:hypothetical protein MPTK1_2g21745 [Marchantia polymorpha subsp. ruderalis]